MTTTPMTVVYTRLPAPMHAEVVRLAHEYQIPFSRCVRILLALALVNDPHKLMDAASANGFGLL